MNKIKSKSSAKKRFCFTAKRKVKRNKAFSSHLLTKKSARRKRNYRRASIVKKAHTGLMKQMLPYG